MDKLIAFYLRSVSNKHIDMLYRHVIRLELYVEQFAVAAIAAALGSFLVYVAGCVTSGSPAILAIVALSSAVYGMYAIASVDTLVLKEWRARAWVD